MFIISRRNYRVRRADGSLYFIEKDFIGNIPDDVAKSNLVQRAIRGGMICIPEGTKDQQLEQADNQASERAAENDIRPDAMGQADNQDKEDGEDKAEKPKGKGAKG